MICLNYKKEPKIIGLNVKEVHLKSMNGLHE